MPTHLLRLCAFGYFVEPDTQCELDTKQFCKKHKILPNV